MSTRTIGLAAGLCAAAIGFAQYVTAAEATRASRPPGEQQVPTNEGEMRAVETARAELARKLYVSADTLPVLSIEAAAWPNTGLGCATPDTATIRIPRRGHIVVLATPTGPRRVHVAGRRAVICDLPQQALSEPVEKPPTDNLSIMVEQARMDLARRLNKPVDSVRLVSFAAAKWPDSTMDCAVPYEQARKKPTKGYRLQLWQGNRMFIYHTDMVRTRPCSPIDPPKTASGASRGSAAPRQSPFPMIPNPPP